VPGNPQSWNRYIYVGNNPLFWVDPTGLIWGKNEEGKVRWFDKDLGEGFEEFRPENWQYVGRNGRIVQLDPNSSNWSYIDPVEIVAESDPIVDLIQSAGGALDDSLTGLQIGARNTGTELINTLTNPLGIAGAAAGVPNPFEIAPLEPANSHQAAYAIIAEFGITAMASAGVGSALAGPASAGSSLSVVPNAGNAASTTTGLQRQLQLHQDKLVDYARNPYAHDNKGFLRNSPESRHAKIIAGRVRNLVQQIRNFEKQINK
jgi:hypothetical protein